MVEEKGTAEDAGSTLFSGEQEARESLVTRAGAGTTSLQVSQEEGLGHRAWHTVGTWEVVNKGPEIGWSKNELGLGQTRAVKKGCSESVELDRILERWVGLEDGRMGREGVPGEKNVRTEEEGQWREEVWESREVARLQGAFGKLEVAVPRRLKPSVGHSWLFDFPYGLGLTGLGSHAQPCLQAEKEAPDTGQFAETARKTLLLASMLFALSPCLKGPQKESPLELVTLLCKIQIGEVQSESFEGKNTLE